MPGGVAVITSTVELPPLRVHGRIEQLLAALNDRADAIVVTGPAGIRWCTGFTGSNGALLLSAGDRVLFTDGRYADQAPAELQSAGSDVEVNVTADLPRSVAARAKVCGVVSMALEADRLSWSDARRFERHHVGEVVATEGLVADLRSVKSSAELARMSHAALIVDEALKDCVHMLSTEVSERELSLALDDAMRARGAGPAYETIVAGGPLSALPHARPGPRRFRDGDLVVIDAGAVVDGYRSDMTRTFTVGKSSARATEIIGIVTEAQKLGVEAVTAGAEAAAVDAACRNHITKAGYGEVFVHGTGHGVGLEIHELPSVSRSSTAVLRRGQVITVEPGIYISGFGGCRVEDMVSVTEKGCCPLTNFPK